MSPDYFKRKQLKFIIHCHLPLQNLQASIFEMICDDKHFPGNFDFNISGGNPDCLVLCYDYRLFIFANTPWTSINCCRQYYYGAIPVKYPDQHD